MTAAAVHGFPLPGGGTLDVRLAPGEVVRLRGGNGSGKTSLLRALAGLDGPLRPAGVQHDGADPGAMPAAWVVRRAGMTLQAPRDILVGLTVAGEFDLRGREVPADLAPLRARDTAGLSAGEARRVALRIADGGQPLLLMDEPVEGLDPEGVAWLRGVVQDATATVVFVDHTGQLADLADRTVDLSPPRTWGAWDLPRGEGVVFRMAARDVSDRRVLLPAAGVASGLHAVTGSNGAGKSTLLLAAAGMLGADATLDGVPVATGRNVALLTDRPGDLLVGDTVADALRGCDADVVSALVPANLMRRHPARLSGGELQRVALAKTLGRRVPLYLLDEPEAFLDGAGRDALGEVLARRIVEGAVVLAATHDVDVVAAAATRIEVGA